MSDYKLYYLGLRGLGEIARISFTYAGVSFEDFRVSFDDYEQNKAIVPFGQLPVLEVNGEIIKRWPVLRFVASKCGLAGKDDWESAQLDETMDLIKDFMAEIRPCYLLMGDASDPFIQAVQKMTKPKGDKAELFETNFKPAFKRTVKILEKILAKKGSGFFAKSGVSYVDFLMFNFMETFNYHHPELFEGHEAILDHMKRVRELPQLKEYLERRVFTPF